MYKISNFVLNDKEDLLKAFEVLAPPQKEQVLLIAKTLISAQSILKEQ